MIGRTQFVLLALLLVGCGSDVEPTPVATVAVPLATEAPTRPPIPTVTVPPTPAPAAPSATPDMVTLGERYVSRGSVAALRYPAGWRVEESELESEVLITVESPQDAEVGALFVLDLQRLPEALALPELYPVADTFLRNLFEDRYDPAGVTYREEGERLVATVIDVTAGERVQYEIRFLPRPPFLAIQLLVALEEEWDRAAPLLDMMARSVEVNPSVSAVIPTQPPVVERRSEGLSMQHRSVYRSGTGALYVVGEVGNGSAQPYEDVQVTARLLDGTGSELARQQWPAARRLLPPGERSPVRIIFSSFPENWESIDIQVDALPASFYPDRITRAFETRTVEGGEPAFGSYALTGELVNTGEAARFVQLTGTLYDPDGTVLAVETITLEPISVAADAVVPFRLTFFSRAAGDVARHELIAEGIRDDAAP